MKRPDWKINMAGQIVIVIPDSVINVAGIDDDALLREGYPTASWVADGKKAWTLIISPRDFVTLVDTVRHLGEDHLAEGDLSSGGAVRWARNRIPFLIAAGWAKRSPFGGVEPV